MTRITNLGRKRTYLEAGFGKADAHVEEMPEAVHDGELVQTAEEASPTKKPRRRRRNAKTAGHQVESNGLEVEGAMTQVEKQGVQDKRDHAVKRARKEAKRKWAEEEKAAASEARRRRRIAERHAHTTCLACRKQGHTVKDCPDARTTLHEDDTGTGVPGKSVVGICYRCGSTRHNLSRCKKPVDLSCPVPFASCFVCSGRGHLSSSCPRNQGRGIYPNGGSCKLCGNTSHLAKHCELRSQEQASKNAIMLGGTSTEGGADEDDFHVLKRRRDAVHEEERVLQEMAHHSTTVDVKSRPKVVVFR